VVNTESWIIEGVHHKWGQESFKKAELIFIIQPNKLLRDYRVIKRFDTAKRLIGNMSGSAAS
jgi:hypothetical protein